jgi:cytochrome c oxidase subunit 2
LIISIIFFVIVVSGIIYFSIKYKRQNKGELTSGIAHSLKLELLWTIIPSIIVIIIFLWGFNTYVKMSVVPKDALEIKVTAQRWFWAFDYPSGLASVNDLVVPVNKPIKLLMSSTDVIHGFFVPAFRLKKDVLPNRYTVAWFESSTPGEYDLFCTQYCGKGHSQMLGKIRVLSDSEYGKWLETGGSVASVGQSPEQLGAALYKSRACYTCHSTDGSRSVGPTFRGIFGHEVNLSDGKEITVDENYIRESILEPQAKVVAGFQPVMPTYQGLLKDKDVDALIAYIKSLQK